LRRADPIYGGGFSLHEQRGTTTTGVAWVVASFECRWVGRRSDGVSRRFAKNGINFPLEPFLDFLHGISEGGSGLMAGLAALALY
jgi:hypothetical protein